MPVSKKKYVLKGFLEPNSAKKKHLEKQFPKARYSDRNEYAVRLEFLLRGSG